MADYIKKNIGKNTIGDNNKMQVNLRTYNRSTHNLSTIWRNTQSVGTLVPSLCELALMGDTWEINIQQEAITHPTVGPLYGSFKLETHIFSIPIRLYNSWLHNNRNGIGMNMSQIKLPQISVQLIGNGSLKTTGANLDRPSKNDNFTQINPSCILAYLGLRGYEYPVTQVSETNYYSEKNAIPLLAYWDIFKNYYSNKQEENYYMITGAMDLIVLYEGKKLNINSINIPFQANNQLVFTQLPTTNEFQKIMITIVNSYNGSKIEAKLADGGTYDETTGVFTFKSSASIEKMYVENMTVLKAFPLEELDEIRDQILSTKGNIPFKLNSKSNLKIVQEFFKRYNTGIATVPGKLYTSNNQFGLLLKTYNSDIYNNWIDTEWIDGPNGINEITSVSTIDGSFTIDALNLARKVYDMLNRIAVSGGTYKDWLETVYTTDYIERCETPIFEGGCKQTIAFQEVISNSASGEEPLGTLAGRGVLAGKQKGGTIKVKITEPSFIIGITSITPNIDYGQGNRFYTKIENLDQIHKPQLDGIGYQDLLTDGMAWWTKDNIGNPIPSVGKSVAWIEYMTNVNRTFGNFAPTKNESFMVLNRDYGYMQAGSKAAIDDLTTYIDPAKYNYIFADTSLDSMNFWVQIGYNINCRRVMSAKSIPNL